MQGKVPAAASDSNIGKDFPKRILFNTPSLYFFDFQRGF
jgi:hypothetical protein